MKLQIIAAAILLTGSALAKEVSLPLSDAEQQTIINLQLFEDQCVGMMMTRGDVTVCRNVSAFLGQLAAEARQAIDRAAIEPKPPEDKPPAQ